MPPLLAPSKSFSNTGLIGVYESLSTHSSALILRKVYHIPLLLLHRQERDLAQIYYARTNVVAVNIEGIAAVQDLISSGRL